jgi:hypothetical protein
MMRRLLTLTTLLLLLLPALTAFAQEAAPAAQPAPPPSHSLVGVAHIPQHWNNCGPATLTMGLTYFGLPADQDPAAAWLKPTSEDGNVSPWQMVAYVNEELSTNVRALKRVGGDQAMLKALLSNDFPVVVEMGYDPEPERLGWMGHYLLLIGYDDATQQFTSMDSYLGPNQVYSYDHVQEFWEHFNNTYIVLYTTDQEPALMTLLGTQADPVQNALHALELNRERALANPADPFAWFNMGTNYVMLAGQDANAYQYAAVAYDKAREIGLPWRMLWYQFGPYEAYNAVGRYQDILDLARIQLNETGTSQYIEETYYYAGLAREGLGETDRALNNYLEAIRLNPNFAPALEARDALQARLSGGTTAVTAGG